MPSTSLQHGIAGVRLRVAVEILKVSVPEQRNHTLQDLPVRDHTKRLMRCGCLFLIHEMENTLRSTGKRLAAGRAKRDIL